MLILFAAIKRSGEYLEVVSDSRKGGQPDGFWLINVNKINYLLLSILYKLPKTSWWAHLFVEIKIFVLEIIDNATLIGEWCRDDNRLNFLHFWTSIECEIRG